MGHNQADIFGCCRGPAVADICFPQETGLDAVGVGAVKIPVPLVADADRDA